MKVKVVSYRHLFGDNNWVTQELERYCIVQDNIKYMPLEVVKQANFVYKEHAVREIDV